MTDALEAAVNGAVAALRTDDPGAVDGAFRALAGLDPQQLLAELFLRVREAADAGDLDELLSLVRLGLPPQPRRIVEAVRANDLAGVISVVGSDLGEVIASLLVITAALDEAATRL